MQTVTMKVKASNSRISATAIKLTGEEFVLFTSDYPEEWLGREASLEKLVMSTIFCSIAMVAEDPDTMACAFSRAVELYEDGTEDG